MIEPYCLRISKIETSNFTSEWCLIQYPNHPKGCPNFGKKKTCPPQAPRIDNVIDINKKMYIVFSEFDLEAHVRNMKNKHPKWTERQCKCVLYWQSRSRKQLMNRIRVAMRKLRCNFITTCPEAMGVNVYATAKNCGLILEPIKTMKICRHIAIIGFRK